MRCPPLLALLALAAACAPTPAALAPTPTAPPGASYSFREWIPNGAPSLIEGWVTLTADGPSVVVKQGACQRLADLPESPLVRYSCAGVALTFDRTDPTLLALFAAQVSVPEPGSYCMQRDLLPGGGCSTGLTQWGSRTEARSGRIRLTPLS